MVDADVANVRKTPRYNLDIRTIVLRDSPGGDVGAGCAVGDIARDKDLRTAVSGHCYSSCSRMCLGGKERFYRDDYPLAWTHVGLHGHYYTDGPQKELLNFDLVQRAGLKR